MKYDTNRNRRLVFIALCLLIGAIILSACALPEIQLPFKAADLAQAVAAEEASTQVTPAESDEGEPSDEAPAEPTQVAPTEMSGEDSLSGLVIFTSAANDPFAVSNAGKSDFDQTARALWGITPDGARTGRLSAEGASSALEPVGIPEGVPLVVAPGFSGASDPAIMVPLPEACRNSLTFCRDYQFGLQGRTYAYLSGEESCGRNLTLVERATGAELQTWQHVAWYRFNQDGGMLIALDDCTNRYVYQYIPNTGSQSGIAPDGDLSWDPSERAALVQVKGTAPVLSSLWGFNLDVSKVIFWPEQGKTMQDSVVWLADGRHFVYQHRTIRYDKESGNAYLEGPRQIILMDAWTRSQHLLAFKGAYDFHLCPTEGESCEQPYGDWLKVTRTPFRAGGLKLKDPGEAQAARCALFGLGCPQPAETFALNWKTGEMLPWDEANLPDPQPAPAFPPPDLGKEPVYSDPAGAFYLYTSADGHTLWYVPLSGDPEPWVTDGENFVFIP